MLVGGISWNNVICPSLRRQYSLVVGGDDGGWRAAAKSTGLSRGL